MASNVILQSSKHQPLTPSFIISSLQEAISLNLVRPDEPLHLLDFTNKIENEPTYSTDIALYFDVTGALVLGPSEGFPS
jgi:hypothetical protein